MVSPHHLGHVGASVFGSRAGRNGDRRGPPQRGAEAEDDQFGALQRAPRAPVRLRGAEIRGLFWQRVAVVERSATSILQWSRWRRWHQAWARYYHHRRRQGQALSAHPHGEKTQPPALLDV